MQAPRLVPRADLVNVLEYEAQARAVLEQSAFVRVAGSDRSGFDRITLRPRLLVPTVALDLGLTLAGQPLHSPIIVGPIDAGALARPEASAELAAGAAAAHAAVIATSLPGPATGGGADSAPFWFGVFAGDPSITDTVRRAADAGCRLVCVTVGAARASSGIRRSSVGSNEWRTVNALVKAAGVPVIVKGVTSPAAALQALQEGAAGIVFSNYGGLLGSAAPSASILELPAIVDAVGGRAPVLMDGGFRRGTDILKALAFGASAVLVARPVVWGLVAYGAEGVQSVLEMLQTELARYMAMCGKASLGALGRDVVRVHAG
jgi:isopentenyl diphosphate isomerase/L-lactate dehydrogenase-like FMN-dependent dehydrogenase